MANGDQATNGKRRALHRGVGEDARTRAPGAPLTGAERALVKALVSALLRDLVDEDDA
jgi:hypothetical protein